MNESAWWRDTARTPRLSLGFASVDARVMYPVIVWFFLPRTWTAAVVLVTAAALAVAEIWRMTPPAAAKGLWLWIATAGFRSGHIAGGVVSPPLKRTLD